MRVITILNNKSEMKKFYLPVTWEECGVVEVEATSLEEAVEYFKENSCNINTPHESHYVEGSFCLSTDEVEELQFIHEDEKKRREQL
jgi:hypothetical protein